MAKPFPEIDRIAALSLNAAHLVETGPLDAAALERLLAVAFHAEAPRDATGRTIALLTALEQDANWDSVNFHWFRARRPRFVYVDRIITTPAARGRGVARGLYEALFGRARAGGHGRVCAEVNLSPPNPASMAFHEALGFVEAGRAALANGKTVRYLERDL